MGMIEKWGYLRGLPQKMALAKAIGGKSYATQVREILRLRQAASHFGVDDYFDYRLFAPDWLSPQEDVAGWEMANWLDDRLNPPAWRHLALDKHAMYALLHEADLPIPRIYGVFQHQGRPFSGAHSFQTEAALVAALRGDFPYPFFAKPILGDVGTGTFAVQAYVPEEDALLFTNGERMPVERFVASLNERRKYCLPEHGFLLQELLYLDPRLEPVCGDRISSVRAIVLLHDEGPELISATWKVIVGNSMNDNYDGGRTGNLLAAVDEHSGTVQRVIHGHGFAQRCFSHHPLSGEPLVGRVLPDWDALKALVLRGASAFPMLRFQHWDIAYSSRGLVILEMNVTGSLDGIQFASGRGLYDARMRNFVARYGRTPPAKRH